MLMACGCCCYHQMILKKNLKWSFLLNRTSIITVFWIADNYAVYIAISLMEEAVYN